MTEIQSRIDALIAEKYDPRYRLPFNYSSEVLQTSCVVKTDEGYLYGFTVYNSGPAQWIQVYDARVLPADGVVPRGPVIPIAADSDREMLWIPPRYFATGLVICNSTTDTTKTLGAADCLFDVQYV